MTDTELAAIQARLDAATAGRWEAVYEEGLWWVCTETRNSWGHRDVRSIHGIDGTLEREDAKFAAAAHQDIPALLAEVRRLRQEREELTQALRLSVANTDDCFKVAGELQQILLRLANR